MEKKSFVARVLGFLKIDDDAKVAKFQKQSLKTIAKQVKIRKDKIEELKEKRAEYQDEVAPETVLNIDVEKIKTLEQRTAYFSNVYMRTLQDVKEKIDSYDAEIETLEDEIVNYEWMADQMA